MSAAALFFVLAALDVAGLFAIWLLIKSKVARYLELDNLLAGVRDEARALVLELNETADRNVSLVEDRMESLRSLLAEVDRRIGVEKRELGTRAAEREVYAKLSKRRPIVPEADRGPVPASPARPEPPQDNAPAAARPAEELPITLSLGSEARVQEAGRLGPEVLLSDDLVASSKTKREEALDLYRRGISADLIAARLGVTVAEIELLVEMEERRAAGFGESF
jgi:hypothetical protein